MIHTDAGYYTPVTPPAWAGSPSYAHIWYLRDHLENNRVLADGSGNAVAIHDYDPYGEEIAVASSSQPYPLPPGATDSPYLYGGKEWNATTSTYDFEARYLSPSFHRFTTMDPLAEKFYGISPYAYCANNPVNLVDPSGCVDWKLVWSGTTNLVIGAGMAIAGAAIVGASGGTGSLLGGGLFLEGGGQAVFGFTNVIVGLLSDPSEETEKLRTEGLNSPSDAVGLIGDEVFGNSNGEIRKGVKTTTTVISAMTKLPVEMNSTTKAFLKLESIITAGVEVSKLVKSDTSDHQTSLTVKGEMTDDDYRNYQYSKGQDYFLWYGER